MPRFSVIVPLYNGAKYIEKTLDTAVNQSFKDFEVVICNDGSTDNSAEIANAYIKNHPAIRFIYIEQKNKGLGGARNTAMKNAEGEIFALLDQDDFWAADKLEKADDAFKKTGADIICHQEQIIKNSSVAGVSKYGPYSNEMFRALLFKGNRLSTSATLFKKTVFAEVGGFSEDVVNVHFVEDYDYWLRIAMKGFKFHFIDDILGSYVLHEENYSENNIQMMCLHEKNVIDLNYKRYSTKRSFDWLLIKKRKSRLYLSYAKKCLKNMKLLMFFMFLSKACLVWTEGWWKSNKSALTNNIAEKQ